MNTFKNFTSTRAYRRLKEIFPTLPHLKKLYAGNQKHAFIQTGESFFDFTRTHLTAEIRQLMSEILEELDFSGQRTALFRGEPVNTTEGRAALHPLLRAGEEILASVNKETRAYIRKTDKQLAEWTRRFREGAWTGATGKPLTTFVNIGIGGSYLGPHAVIELLRDKQARPHRFLSNVDDHHLADIMDSIDLETTLFGIISKSFGTKETLQNARTVKRILEEKFGAGKAVRHFFAVTARPDRAQWFGIPAGQILPMKDWIGGRFSLWSVAGVAIPFVLGYETFARLKKGARAMDEHFLRMPDAQNIPVLWAMFNILYRLLAHAPSEVVISYRERFAPMLAHMQQVSMESLGKSVQRNGQPVEYPTGAIVWGGTGTNAQHSFFQLLHQGTNPSPVFFTGSIDEDTPYLTNRRELLANMLAQADALAFGKKAGNPHEHFEGNRPSVTWIFERWTPENTGFFLAAWEHKIFVESIFYNINAFDQPGVELGKKLAADYARAFESGDPMPNPSYAFIRQKIRSKS